MRHASRTWTGAAAVALLAAAALAFWPQRRDPLPGLPRVFVWAWERPENLEPLDTRAAGVAFLARTVILHNGTVTVRPRQHPLRYRPGAALMPVVRVESDGTALPDAERTAEAIAPAAAVSGARALQVDFDARRSERAFYREVLLELRRLVPANMPLSMTALASWCESGGWLAGMPVAEAVPMLFRMGTNQGLRGERDPLCQSSVGVSTDEWPATPPGGRRVYLFSERAWTQETLRAALREVSQW